MKMSRGQFIASAICIIPLVSIVVNYALNDLTANPIQAATLRTGRTAINLLVLSLACTPVRNLFGMTSFLKIRKTLGLFAFFYAFLHFLIFAGLDFEFNLSWIIDEFRYKLFIQIGFVALVMLIILGVTSIKNIQGRMGKSWEILHRLVYFSALLAILHYFLATKGDIFKPILYAAITSVLLLLRIPTITKINFTHKIRILNPVNIFLMHEGLK